jgi:hypothetical protein
MAYQLSNYKDEFGTTHSAAYLRITDVQILHRKQQAIVSFEIYADAASADDGSSLPLKSDGYVFADNSTSGTTLYTSSFVTTLGTDPLGTQPTIVNNIIQCQSYLAMKNHPSLTSLLAGATAV